MKFGICLPIRLDADAHKNINIAKAAEDLGEIFSIMEMVSEGILPLFRD